MKRNSKKRGEGVLQWIMIVVIIAIGCLTILTFFGNHIKSLFYAADESITSGVTTKPKFDKTPGAKHHQINDPGAQAGGSGSK